MYLLIILLRWEVPSPSMIQKIYSSSSMDGTDPRFLKLRPVFRCAKVKCGNRQRYINFYFSFCY
jgi:general transcription factor 3C polypeptide 2